MIPNLKEAFPNLEAEGYEETSPATSMWQGNPFHETRHIEVTHTAAAM